MILKPDFRLLLYIFFLSLQNIYAQTGIPVIFEVKLEKPDSPYCEGSFQPLKDYPVMIEFGDSVRYILYTDTNGIAYDTVYAPVLPQDNYPGPYPCVVKVLDSANMGADPWNSFGTARSDPYGPYVQLKRHFWVNKPYENLDNCSTFVLYTKSYANDPKKLKFYSTYAKPSLNIYWDFGDGNTSDEMFPEHQYSSAGTYTYCLTIDNCPIVCDSVTIEPFDTINCDDISVRYNFNSDFFLSLESNIQIDGSNSFWSLSDGSTFSSNTPGISYEGDTLVYCLNLEGCSKVCDTIRPLSTCNPQFSWNAVDQDSGLIEIEIKNYNPQLLYLWSVTGDVSAADTIEHNRIVNDIFSVEYSSPGSFKSALIAVDTAEDCSSSYCENIIISPYCEAGFYIDTSASVGTNIVIVNTTLPDSSLSYYWQFGDGHFSMLPFPTHTYDYPGRYEVCLSISGDGCMDTYCDSISFYPSGNKVYSAFTINIISPESIGQKEVITNSDIHIYPNPANDRVFVESSLEIQQVFLYDLSGRLVEKEFTQNNYLDIGHLGKGVYVLMIQTDDGSRESFKLVKE